MPAAVAAATRAGPLPPDALRGNEHRLRQYPAVALASARERAAAVDLLAQIRAAVRPWSTPAEAKRAGFDTGQARRRPRRIVVAYLHAEHRVHSHDRGYLVPARPEALIYANVRGRPLSLVGAMFSMPRGKRGPTPGGPITRWHTHTVCARGARRGIAVRGDGSCAAGLRKREGSEMLHVWFTGELRSSFAVHAPEPELCSTRLLPRSLCAGRGHAHPTGSSRPPISHPPPPRPPPPKG